MNPEVWESPRRKSTAADRSVRSTLGWRKEVEIVCSAGSFAELRPFRMTAGLGGFDRAGEVCVLDSLAPGRGLNRFSDCTQDFRPGLLSVAPAGAALGWTGVFSARRQASSWPRSSGDARAYTWRLRRGASSAWSRAGESPRLHTMFEQRQRTGASALHRSRANVSIRLQSAQYSDLPATIPV